MTTTNTTDSNKFNLETIDQAMALYLDARAGREAIKAELAEHERYMSDICKEISEKFGAGPYNLGDGTPRGSIISHRGDLYFIRGKSPGRPSKRPPATAGAVTTARTMTARGLRLRPPASLSTVLDSLLVEESLDNRSASL